MLKDEKAQETWILLTRYNLASLLYNIHNKFQYMISNKNIKAEHPNIEFYYEDIMDYIKKHKMNLDLEKQFKTHI